MIFSSRRTNVEMRPTMSGAWGAPHGYAGARRRCVRKPMEAPSFSSWRISDDRLHPELVPRRLPYTVLVPPSLHVGETSPESLRNIGGLLRGWSRSRPSRFLPHVAVAASDEVPSTARSTRNPVHSRRRGRTSPPEIRPLVARVTPLVVSLELKDRGGLDSLPSAGARRGIRPPPLSRAGITRVPARDEVEASRILASIISPRMETCAWRSAAVHVSVIAAGGDSPVFAVPLDRDVVALEGLADLTGSSSTAARRSPP